MRLKSKYTIFYAKVDEWGVVKVPEDTVKDFKSKYPITTLFNTEAEAKVA